MQYKYFHACTTAEEAKSLYKKLARENHPDLGGNTRTMQEINAEYSHFCANHATNEARNRQREAHAQGKKSAGDYHDLENLAQSLREMIDFALTLDGVEIELMGLWVWLSGETKKHRDALKQWNDAHRNPDADPQLIWKWSPNKTAWYFAGVPTFNRKKTTLDEIRNTYGSKSFRRESQQREDNAPKFIPQT
jgi:hypothetical protein